MTAKTYSSDDLDVHFDLKRCIHAGVCVKQKPEVFDIKARPWIQPGNAPASDLVAVVESCPSGALQYTRRGDGEAEVGSPRNQVQITADGQLEFRGRLQWEGQTLLRAALCRCGASQNKPFCDNAHKGSGFADDGLPDAGDVDDAGLGGGLACAAFPDGPLHLSGGVEVLAADGEVIFRGEQTWLCRCGQSANKPFCDGAHKREGWTSAN